MRAVTLPTVPLLRSINNDILADVLLYSFHSRTSAWCRQSGALRHGLTLAAQDAIRNMVARAMNDEYARFLRRHPEFTGRIALFGHSLGGIVSYDLIMGVQMRLADHNGNLLRNQLGDGACYDDIPLAFTPNYLFTVGSPIAPYSVLRNIPFTLPPRTAFVNIFRTLCCHGYGLLLAPLPLVTAAVVAAAAL